MRHDTKNCFRLKKAKGDDAVWLVCVDENGEQVGAIPFENFADMKSCGVAMADFENPTWAAAFNASLHG